MTESKHVLLQVDNLKVAFGQKNGPSIEVVHGINFDVHAGEVLALVGESGSGKSVTSLSIMRLLDNSRVEYPEGSVQWLGKNLITAEDNELRKIRGSQIAMIFQEPMTALNPTMTCGDQLIEALDLHTDLDEAAKRTRAIELFKSVGLSEAEQRLDQYPHELSGGMRQRVCIAIALSCEPELLIADEPTTALDVTVQAQILDLLSELREKHDLAIIFITHDLGVVAELADRVAIMQKGYLVECNTVTEIFDNAQHPYTQGLLACRPRMGARLPRLPTVSDYLKDH